jgi:hypothetical protein
MIRIGRWVELWWCWPWECAVDDCPGGCKLYSLGFFGVTLLRGSCPEVVSDE